MYVWQHRCYLIGHVITVQSSQGSTLEYIKGDFDCISKNSKPNPVPIDQGAMYTIV